MITNLHARPNLRATFHAMPLNKLSICPHCSKVVGTTYRTSFMKDMPYVHRCSGATREVLQPSTAVPFN